MEFPGESSGVESTVLEGIECYHPDRAYGCKDYPEEELTNLVSIESGHFWFESRNQIFRTLVERYLAPGAVAKKFLEIGCGTGFVLRMLTEISGLEVSGSEIYLSGAKIAASRVSRAKIFQMDALRMKFQRAYDAIGLFDVLEHIEEDVKIIQLCHNALKEKGIIFIAVPQYPAFWSLHDTRAGHKRRYTKIELKNKIEQNGFQILYIGSIFCFAFPLYAISRMRKKCLSIDENEKQLMSEFRLSPWLNSMLKIICWFDLLAVRTGFRLPFGSSLMLIARATKS